MNPYFSYCVPLLRLWKGCLLAGLLLSALPLCAQQFSVQRFRALPNDISAYIEPVKDLNDEACALLKVVANPDFAFSTPLGIVKRRNEVGEIWLYVPHGTLQITIKHPEWGVVRDYRLPFPLESRMTYELVLQTPSLSVVGKGEVPRINESPRFYYAAPAYASSLPLPPARQLRKPLRVFGLAEAVFSSSRLSGGLRVGLMRRHGAYLHAVSDFQRLPDTGDRVCDSEGVVDGVGMAPYYTGQVKRSDYAFLAGAIHRVWRGICIYEGVGYGNYTVAWESQGGDYYRNADYSVKGFAAEAGALLRWRGMAFSLGALTTAGKHWACTVGVGLSL